MFLCDALQGTTSHLNVDSGSQELRGDGSHIEGLALAELEVTAESITTASIGHHEVLVAPFLSQDLGESVVV